MIVLKKDIINYKTVVLIKFRFEFITSVGSKKLVLQIIVSKIWVIKSETKGNYSFQ